MQYFKPVNYGESVQARPEFSFRFVQAAHIIGSSLVEITLSTNGTKRALLFTGDIGRVRDSEIAPGKVVHSGPTEGESADLRVFLCSAADSRCTHSDAAQDGRGPVDRQRE